MKKILPFIGLLGTASVVVPTVVSCAKEKAEIPTLECTSDKIFTTDSSGTHTLEFIYGGSDKYGVFAYAVTESDETESYEPRVIISGSSLIDVNKFSLSIEIYDEVGTTIRFNLRILVLDNDQCLWYEQKGFVATIGE